MELMSRWQHELDIKEKSPFEEKWNMQTISLWEEGRRKGQLYKSSGPIARGICKMWYCEDSYKQEILNPVQTEVRLTQQSPLTHTHTHSNGLTESHVRLRQKNLFVSVCGFSSPRSTFNKNYKRCIFKSYKNCHEIRQSIGPDQEDCFLEWSPLKITDALKDLGKACLNRCGEFKHGDETI